MVIFISQSEKKAVLTVRKILDSFADRIGDDAWQTVITGAGLLAVKAALRRNATKSMAVSCRWIRSRSRSELLWIVGNRNKFNAEGLVPVNWTQKNVSHFEWENQWQYLPLIKALAAVAALFHDWGKTNDYLSVKFYSVGEFSRNNKRGKPPLEWKCYNFRAQIKQRKGFPHGYYNRNWRNLE